MRQSSSAGLCRGRIRAAGQTVPRGGRFQRAKPAGPGCAGAACGPPLPLRKLRLYTKYNPYNSIKFILFSTDLPPSAIRRTSISCQKSASIGPSPCKGLAWETAARPLLHRLCARPRNRGAAPSGLSYTYCILLSNYTSIRRNPPWLCDYKCRVSFLPHQNSAEQSSERKSKITSSTMVYAWKKRGHPTVGRAYPLGSSKAGLYDTSRDTNLPSLPHFPLRPFRRPQTPYQDKMPFPVILRRPSPHPPPAALCRPASVIPRHGGAAGPPPAPH